MDAVIFGIQWDSLPYYNQTDSVARPSVQNFIPLNRGDMFVPSGSVASNVLLARLATPLGTGGSYANPIPVAYVIANSDVRPKQAIGMVTPNYKG